MRCLQLKSLSSLISEITAVRKTCVFQSIHNKKAMHRRMMLKSAAMGPRRLDLSVVFPIGKA